MAQISKVERKRLYEQIRVLVSGKRDFDLDEEQLDVLFDVAIEDYSSYVNQWLIEQQWVSLQGLEVDSANFIDAYTTKTNDFMRSFTYAYSKQVGLGANAPSGNTWHLKKDFIIVTADTQVYSIPSGREINEILWFTPPQIDSGLVDPQSWSAWSPGAGGWSYMGRPANYIQPTYSLLLTAQDRDTKKRILQSELTYRITGGPNGTKLLYLYPIPGSRQEITNQWGKTYAGHKVWYFYYDTNNKGRKKCLENNSDIIKLPSDAPLDVVKWTSVNSVGKANIRDLFLAHVKITIGNQRGKYSGAVGATYKDLTMDYRMLLEQGETLKAEVRTAILESLGRLSLVQLTRDRAEIAANVNKERGFQPPDTPLLVM